MYKAWLNETMPPNYGHTGMFANTLDAVWAAALALNNSVARLPPNTTLADFNYGRQDIAEIILDEVKKLSFYGATVRLF